MYTSINIVQFLTLESSWTGIDFKAEK